jgi:purine catabolism regulator
MFTVADIAGISGLDLPVAAGAAGLEREVTWLHASELADPTPFLEGGEFLLTTGLGVGAVATTQRAYVRRLAEHGLAGLGFGVGFGFSSVPPGVIEEADRTAFPVLSVPYEVPFVTITKATARELTNARVAQLTDAIELHERLVDAVLQGRGAQGLLAIAGGHLRCSLALVDEAGDVVAECHAGARLRFDRALELPVAAAGAAALRAVRDGEPLGDYDLLVLHHTQAALAFELANREAVTAAELRLAGDLIADLERGRLDDREAARRMEAFGLEPEKSYAALLATSRTGAGSARVRRSVARELERRAVAHLSTARRERAEFIVEAPDEGAAIDLARKVVAGSGEARVAVGRPAHGRDLGRSLLEARAALDAVPGDVATYRDLGSLELLIGLPDAALQAFVERVLGDVAANERLLESLRALLECGGRWSEAARQLGVHRHTLRYRMDRLRDHTGRHPDDPDDRMELWLAVKAHQALRARHARGC